MLTQEAGTYIREDEMILSWAPVSITEYSFLHVFLPYLLCNFGIPFPAERSNKKEIRLQLY
jgi:hypothetical protein